eukprot:scaffold1908_cov104-Isochrysis_galbana.AAC.9
MPAMALPPSSPTPSAGRGRSHLEDARFHALLCRFGVEPRQEFDCGWGHRLPRGGLRAVCRPEAQHSHHALLVVGLAEQRRCGDGHDDTDHQQRRQPPLHQARGRRKRHAFRHVSDAVRRPPKVTREEIVHGRGRRRLAAKPRVVGTAPHPELPPVAVSRQGSGEGCRVTARHSRPWTVRPRQFAVHGRRWREGVRRRRPTPAEEGEARQKVGQEQRESEARLRPGASQLKARVEHGKRRNRKQPSRAQNSPPPRATAGRRGRVGPGAVLGLGVGRQTGGGVRHVADGRTQLRLPFGEGLPSGAPPSSARPGAACAAHPAAAPAAVGHPQVQQRQPLRQHVERLRRRRLCRDNPQVTSPSAPTIRRPSFRRGRIRSASSGSGRANLATRRRRPETPRPAPGTPSALAPAGGRMWLVGLIGPAHLYRRPLEVDHAPQLPQQLIARFGHTLVVQQQRVRLVHPQHKQPLRPAHAPQPVPALFKHSSAPHAPHPLSGPRARRQRARRRVGVAPADDDLVPLLARHRVAHRRGRRHARTARPPSKPRGG